MGAIVASRSIPVAGGDFDRRIVARLTRRPRVLIGERTAAQIKLQIGSTIHPCAGRLAADPRPRHGLRGIQARAAHQVGAGPSAPDRQQ
jgi:hypothetical protein